MKSLRGRVRCWICTRELMLVRGLVVCRACDNVDHWPPADREEVEV